MSTEVAQIDGWKLSQSDIDTLASAGIVPKDTPVEQVEVFARVCQEKGLSPFSGEIHLVCYDTKNGQIWARITGIDGFRKRAAMTGESAGKDAPQFNVKSDGSFMTLSEAKESTKYPVSCRVTVYRIKQGVRVPFVGEVLFAEYAGKKWDYKEKKWVLNHNWSSKPFHMLAKCAEAMAYKAGFADQLSGLHIPEERGAYENDPDSNLRSESEQEKRAKEIKILKSKLDKMNVDDARKLYDQNPQWKDDDEITQIFIDQYEGQG